MANRRPPWKIPAVINPPERRCIQINIPDDPEHIAIFWGVLRGLSDWQRWEHEPSKSGTLVAQVWREVVYAIDWEDSCMGCCEDRIVLHRVTDGGAMEVSTDDGASWHSDPDDPRIIGTHLPNTIEGTGSDKRCNAATNAIGNFKDTQASFGNSLTTATSVIGLAAALAAEVLLLLFSAGTGAVVLIPVMIATATGLFGVLESSYNAEFTEEVWDLLTCDIFCTIGANGQFNESQFINLQAKVDTDFSDNVALTFQSILRGWGVLGLNNACISGIAATADCSECDCPDPCVHPEDYFALGAVDDVIYNEDGTITIHAHSTPAPDDTEAVKWWGEPHDVACCNIVSFTVTDPETGSTPGWFHRDCLGAEGGSDSFTPGCYQWVQYIQNFALTTPFHAVITFGAECP